jgi:hypothetical protein
VSGSIERQIMQDRRNATRRRSYLGAKMAFSSQGSVVECLVRDFTDVGVRVECPGAVTLPEEELDFTIACKGLRVRARIVWRQGKQLGLAFAANPAAAHEGDSAVPIGTAQLVAMLQAANADLRRRVSQLDERR